MIVLEGKDSYKILVEDNGFREVEQIQKESGSYKFAGDKLGLRILICHSNKNGLTLYEAENREGFKEVYRTEAEFNRIIYGDPENVIFTMRIDMDEC